LYAVIDDYNHKLNSPEIIGTVRQTFGNEAKGNGQKLMFVDLSTKSSKLTDNARAIQARYNKGYSHHSGEVSGEMQNYRIRRLTPKECERLMGLSDDWTRYGVKPDGTQYELSDSARYKLCGNGVVVNVVKAIIDFL
jgi:DNA (cytosine-5)-methyltransferase 1